MIISYRWFGEKNNPSSPFCKNVESHSPMDALRQIWLKLAQRFWRRFSNFVNVFSLFRDYTLLENGGALHLKKLESSSPKNALCQVWWSPLYEQTWVLITHGCFVSSLVEIGQVVLARKMKIWKFYDDNDDGQWTKLTWAFVSGELKTMDVPGYSHRDLQDF